MTIDSTTPVVCVPGWGFGPQVWAPLRAACADVLAGRGVQVVDLWRDSVFDALPDRFIGMGHSLGVLWLLRNMADRMQACVSIAGFTRFPVAARVLERMQARFQDDPERVLMDFRMRCFAGTDVVGMHPPHPPPLPSRERGGDRAYCAHSPIRKETLFAPSPLGGVGWGEGENASSLSPQLLQGLGWLMEWQADLPACPLLALHGAGDVIVPLADATAQFPDLLVCPDAPHALPLTHPEWCAARIRDFLG